MSTNFLEQARRFVKDAEISVKGLLSQVAGQGDYDSLAPIAHIAKELQRIGTDTNSHPPVTASPPETASYPKFSRNGEGKLRMIGWSKKKGGEYKHEAPKVVLDLVVEALAQNGPDGEPMPMEELLEYVVHPETGREFPEYYTRTCLRWLRKVGLVKKYGHSGYGFTAKASDDPDPVVEAHRKQLPIQE
jgi:hypothetical protein